MKFLVVCASLCVASVSAGFASFGANANLQANSLGGGGGYSGQNGGDLLASNGGYSGGGLNSREMASLLGNVLGGAQGNLGLGGNLGGSGLVGGRFRGSSNGNGNGISGNSQGESLGNAGNQQGGQVRRFVSVHVAPEEPVNQQTRVIRAGGPADTHYNIIFVKAPSPSNQQQTEVILPEAPQQKTLVYVLVKKPEENQDNVKIRAPAPTKPSRPEVYFIRYKPEGSAAAGVPGNGGDFAAGGIGGGIAGANFASGGRGSTSAGLAFQQNGVGANGGYQ